MSTEMDLDPDGLRQVADELADLRVAVAALTGHLWQCTATAEHFGVPGTEGHLGARFVAAREEVGTALAGTGQLISILVDELRARVDVVVAADQRSEQELRAVGGGLA